MIGYDNFIVTNKEIYEQKMSELNHSLTYSFYSIWQTIQKKRRFTRTTDFNDQMKVNSDKHCGTIKRWPWTTVNTLNI